MYNVSNDYKIAMDKHLRDRTYMWVYFKMLNLQVQNSASIDTSYTSFHPLSTPNGVFETDPGYEYAMFEPNFIRADGSFRFPPRLPLTETNKTMHNGLISDVVFSSSSDSWMVVIDVASPSEINGLEITFGGRPPEDFDVVGSNGGMAFIRGNTDSRVTINEVFIATNTFILTFHKVPVLGSRIRIQNIAFGHYLDYNHDNIISASLVESASPICEELPQSDFEVVLDNTNNYFNLDDPDSAIHYLRIGQEIEVFIGQELENLDVEWIPMGVFELSEWASNRTTATLRATDRLRRLDGTFLGTQVVDEDNVKTYHELMEFITADAGFRHINWDSIMNEPGFSTHCPVPILPVKEALQLIGNAARMVMRVQRDGEIHMGPRPASFTPVRTLTLMDTIEYPNALKRNVLESINVPFYNHLLNVLGEEEDLASQSVQVSTGALITLTWSDPAIVYGVVTDSQTPLEGAYIESWSAYSVTVAVGNANNSKLIVRGRKYQTTKQITKTYVNGGEGSGVIEWDNPMVDTYQHAFAMGYYLNQYHNDPMEYEYTTRGNPELDVLDVIRQPNDFDEKGVLVRIVRRQLTYNGALSERLSVRREN